MLCQNIPMKLSKEDELCPVSVWKLLKIPSCLWTALAKEMRKSKPSQS